MVYITYDMSDIVKHCDRIGVLQNGVMNHRYPQGSGRKLRGIRLLQHIPRRSSIQAIKRNG
ncbi:hypothetical protein [Peribacillus butanolivorans]|uniref:hypothetical protein n=1 Tax=Peribacillus butanolivorans TaxID=421767 RepID=UPI00167F77BE|nr:hypothetical protein [Peribacillus butanolivorans]QNU06628.1 hypothetical protein GM240_23960 [Peribacillus butanolivorans]